MVGLLTRRNRRGYTGRVKPGTLALACLLAACGLRSGADDEAEAGTFADEGFMTDPTEVDPREGSCDTPFILPIANIEVRGRLLGPGSVRGWCGKGDSDLDAGPEDSYSITPSYNVDITVLIPEADFQPTLRVTRDGCREDVLPSVCAAPISDKIWHFLAEVDHTYTITVDSPEGTDGRYKMQLVYGDPGLAACPIHPTEVDQEPGGYFTWSNGLGARQGQVDGLCGGPGAENMFQVNVGYPGNFLFRLEGSESFAPVLSVRTGCGGVTELACTSAAQTGSNFIEIGQFLTPGVYYVVADQGDVRGGDYKLEVYSE